MYCKGSWCVGLKHERSFLFEGGGGNCLKSGTEKRGFKNLNKGEAGSKLGQGVGAYIDR